MKTEDIFHWHIFICSRQCKRHYYSFIRWCRFENFVFVLLCLFLQPAPAVGKLIPLLPARSLRKHFSFTARPIGKTTSHQPVRWKKLLSFGGPARCQNYFSFAGPGPCRLLVPVDRCPAPACTPSCNNYINVNLYFQA